MKRVIITQEQSDNLARILNEWNFKEPGPQKPDMKKANEPYCINPEKVLIVKRFLDKGFTAHDYEKIGANGLPMKIKVVSMNASNGEPLKWFYQDQLQDLLIDHFQNMFLNHNERALFMAQVLKDWLNGAIGVHGNLSVNRLMENVERKNDKGEVVPQKCNKCGGKINLELHGEPVYICSECGKYFGTMPCDMNESIVTEKGGVLDDSFNELAEYIYNIAKQHYDVKKYDFEELVPTEIVKKYYSYESPKNLLIKSDGRLKGKMAFDNNILFINPNEFLKGTEKQNLSNIMHELTHYVNFSEGTIKQIMTIANNESLTRFLYLFRPTELNARVTGFSTILKSDSQIKSIDEYEKYTHLEEMLSFLTQETMLKFQGMLIQNNLSTKIEDYQKVYTKYRKKIFRVYYDCIKELIKRDGVD